MNESEHKLRERLGIPADADKVIVFGESSHWDPNWLFTSEQYYTMRIRRILNEVIEALESNPRRVFSVECIYFLRMYFEREPDKRETLRRLVNERRLRLTGSGITTPDVTLPDTEAILRDYLLGQEWLRENGMKVEPRLAYLPDDFGYSPATPAILRALGFDMAGIGRIDGMYFVGSDYRRRSRFPLPGSSAQLLLEKQKTLDFIWRAPDGSEILTHWNAFTYFQGDMLAHQGVIRWMGLVFGFPWRTERHIARRVASFAAELAPQARTPYLYCPIGCDFNGPIPGLVGLLDRYNRVRFPRTGLFAVNAGMDDYLALVDEYRGDLPTLELDPNPYWMGFYASRPGIKKRCRRISRTLGLAEKLSCLPLLTGTGVRKCEPDGDLDAAWQIAVVSNHHDFITGTSPDRVYHKEQDPWLNDGVRLAHQALEASRQGVDRAPACTGCTPPAWRQSRGRLVVKSDHYRVVLDEARGGCMVSYTAGEQNQEQLTGPANDLVLYRDSGGLWRMGHEYLGGGFKERHRASQSRARVQAREHRGMLEVRVDSDLDFLPFTRWMWFRDDSPIIRMRIVGQAPRRTTVTCRFPTRFEGETLEMDVPGGAVTRPIRKLYDPTFWCARSFVRYPDTKSDRGLAAFLGGPACASVTRPGVLEWVALRNATSERAFGILPVAAHPASGSDPDRHEFEYAVWLMLEKETDVGDLARISERVLGESWLSPGEPDWQALADNAVGTDCSNVRVTAIKKAHRGEGLVIRLRRYGHDTGDVCLNLPGGSILRAWRCDARERDLDELRVHEGRVRVDMPQSMASVRLILDPPNAAESPL